MISAERLAELRRLTTEPVEYSSAQWGAVQSQLAGSVPELLDTIGELLAAVRALSPTG